MNLKNITTLILITTLVGCSALEGFKPLPDTVPDGYLNTSAASVDAGADAEEIGHWWLSFEDQRLNALLDHVLEDNYKVKQAFSRLAQLRARHQTTRSRLFPTFEVAARAERSRLDVRTFGNTSSNFQLSVPVVYELDLFGKVRNQTKAAFKDTIASEYDYQAVTMSVTAEVVDTYYLIAEICEQLALVDRTIASDEGFLNIVERRYRDGLSTPLDVYQAKLNLASDKARRPTLENNLAKASHQLSVLESEYPRQGIRCESFKIPREIPFIPPGLPGSLITRRPDLKAALLRLESADARYAAAVAARFPQITLSAAGGYANPETSKVLQPQSLVWRIAADAGLTLIDFGGKRGQAEEAEFGVFEQRDAYFEALLTAFKEVEDALVGEEKLRESVRLQEARVKAHRDALRVSTEQYLQGITSFLDVLVSQGQYYQARRDLLSTRRNLITNHVQLARALGGGWSRAEALDARESESEPEEIKEAEVASAP